MSKYTRWIPIPLAGGSSSSSSDNMRDRQQAIPNVQDHFEFPRMRYQPEMSQTNGRLKDIKTTSQSEYQVVINTVLEALERDKQNLELDLRDTTIFCHDLKDRLDNSNRALETSHKDAMRYKDELGDMKRKHDQCEQYHVPSLTKLTKDLEEAKLAAKGKATIQTTLSNTEVRLNDTIRELSALQHDHQKTLELLSTLQHNHQQTLELLQVRSDELREADYFLNKRDNISDDQVIIIIDDINANVASIAVDIVQHFGSTLSMKGNELSVAKLSTSIGDHFLEDLRTFEHRYDTSLVEWALRSEICHQIYDVFNCWDDTSTELDQNIQGIHKKIRKEEPQTISARWRSLTCRYTSHKTLEERVRGRVAYNVRKIAQILLISGAPIEPMHLEAQCKEYYGASLTELWSAVFRTVNKFRETIISSDYSVEVVLAGEEFKPYRMQPQGVGSTKGPSDNDPFAVCTAALGLRRIRHIDGRGGDDKGKLEEMYILKPAIVLPSDVMHVKQAYDMAVATITPLPLAPESSQYRSQENRSVFEPQTGQVDTPTGRIPLSIPPPPPLPAGAAIATVPTPSQQSEGTHGADRRTTQTTSTPAPAPISNVPVPGSRINRANPTKSPLANKAPGRSSNGTTSRTNLSPASRAKSLQTSASGTNMEVVASSRTTGPRPQNSSLQSTSTFDTRRSVTSASESLVARRPDTKVGDQNKPLDGARAHDGSGTSKEGQQRTEDPMEIDSK